MTGVHPARLRPRDERAHPVIKDAVLHGHLESGDVYPIDGITGHENAYSAFQAVRNGARHLGMSCAAWVVDDQGAQCNPRKTPCSDESASHGVRFRLFAKNAGRDHVAEESGGDPSKLKYNPFKRAEGPIVDDSGAPIRA